MTGTYEYDLFVSYAHDNNIRDKWVDALVEAIKYEYRQQTGESLSVFQDTVLKPGERWEDRISTALQKSCCLLPVISPAYFKHRFSLKN